MQAVPDKLALQAIFIGHYFDRFDCVEGQWRFTHRLISGDLAGNIAHHRPDMV
jgi:hypothetical protein